MNNEQVPLQAGRSMTKTEARARLSPDLSHDVQNALACIEQFGTIILDGLAGTVSEEQRKYLDIMLKNASIIRNVLDSAREPAPSRDVLTNGVEMEPKRILVVDDNAHLQLAYKKRLTFAGYKVQLASDGEEGLRLALETAPDVIMLDMLMPKLGGVEVLRALKRDPMAARIPVIAVSSLPQSNESKLQEEGAVSYLQKSDLDDSGALLQAIAHALLRRGSNESRQDNSFLELPHHSKTSK